MYEILQDLYKILFKVLITNLILGSTKQIHLLNKKYIIKKNSTRVHFEILLSAFQPHVPALHAWLMPGLGFAEEHKCVTSPLNTINVVGMKCAQAVIYHCLTWQRRTQ